MVGENVLLGSCFIWENRWRGREQIKWRSVRRKWGIVTGESAMQVIKCDVGIVFCSALTATILAPDN